MNKVYPFVANKGFSAARNLDAAMPAPEAAVQRWMHGAGATRVRLQPIVDANQLTSLSAMIAYLATQTGKSEFRIERSLSDRFNVPNTKCLPASQFDNAIRFLVDGFSVL